MTIRLFRLLSLPAVLAAGGLFGLSTPACAVLGGAPMTTPSGATAKTVTPVSHAAAGTSAASGSSATSSTSSTAAYTVKETTLASGTVVREYVGQGGTVFGIAWRGPFMPDLNALLGSYFPQYTSAVAAQRTQRAGHGPVAVEQTGLVVHSGGHMRSYFGNAYLPSALPSGVTGSDIQ